MKRISAELDSKIRAAAADRCGYCLVPQKLLSYKLEIEHLNPRSKGGDSDEENLWLSCRQCNLNKGSRIDGFDIITQLRASIFDPRRQIWDEHFVWNSENTHIVGRTQIGRVTVAALQMNSEFQVIARGFWVKSGIFPE